MAIDLKKILGANFRDDLTLEEIEELLAKDKSMVSAEELIAEKNKSNKFAKEAGDYRKQLNATKTAEELAKQQKDEEMQKIIEANETLTKQLSINENEKKFIAMGYDEDLANKTAKALAEGDMKAFFKHQEIFNENQKKKLKKDILKNTEIPDQTNVDDDEITKEEVSKMSIKDQAKFAEEYPEKYKEFYGKGD